MILIYYKYSSATAAVITYHKLSDKNKRLISTQGVAGLCSCRQEGKIYPPASPHASALRISVTNSDHLDSLLERDLWLHWLHQNNSKLSPYLQVISLIIHAKSLCHVSRYIPRFILPSTPSYHQNIMQLSSHCNYKWCVITLNSYKNTVSYKLVNYDSIFG